MAQGEWRETTIVGRYDDRVIFTTPFNANKHVDWHPNGVDAYRFREIKTEAEKRRDELKLCIMDVLTKQGQHSWQEGIADALIDADLIKPKPLTSHDLKDFWNSHGQSWSWDLMAERINSHIRGDGL